MGGSWLNAKVNIKAKIMQHQHYPWKYLALSMTVDVLTSRGSELPKQILLPNLVPGVSSLSWSMVHTTEVIFSHFVRCFLGDLCSLMPSTHNCISEI